MPNNYNDLPRFPPPVQYAPEPEDPRYYDKEEDQNAPEFDWPPCPHCRKYECGCEIDGLPF